MTATAEKTPDFFAKFYTSAIPEFYFHVDQDKVVTEIFGHGATEGFKKKWIGKHISSVKDDVKNKLYKHSIHSMTWADDQGVLDNLKKKNELEITILRLSVKIKNPEKDDNIQVMKNDLQNSLEEYHQVTAFLNHRRAQDFGEEDVDEYFAIHTNKDEVTVKSGTWSQIK